MTLPLVFLAMGFHDGHRVVIAEMPQKMRRDLSTLLALMLHPRGLGLKDNGEAVGQIEEIYYNVCARFEEQNTRPEYVSIGILHSTVWKVLYALCGKQAYCLTKYHQPLTHTRRDFAMGRG